MSKSKITGESIADLMVRMKVDQWDYLLVGDGSGSTWARPFGSCSVLVSRLTGFGQVFNLASNRGSSNLSEAMAYFVPLDFLAEVERKRLNEGQMPRKQRVVILSDSSYCVRQGNSAMKRGSHAMIWTAYASIARLGFELEWKYVGRETVDLNILADHISRSSRLLIQNANLHEDAETTLGRKIGDYYV